MERDIRMYSECLGCEIIELNVQVDHVHVVVGIPPKVSVSAYMGTIKGKTAIKVFKSYPMLKKKPFWGNHFWARGYFVNKVGINEDIIRRYVNIRKEKNTKRKVTNRASTSILELSLWLHSFKPPALQVVVNLTHLNLIHLCFMRTSNNFLLFSK